MDRVRASAPGKIILFGEHAVVYGEPALGLALSRHAKVEITPGKGRVRIASGKVRASKNAATPQSLVRAALGSLFGRSDVVVSLDFPAMSGLGSSAALAVALLRAKAQLLGREPKIRVMLEEAIRVESIAHGTSSGVDPAIALSEGLILYRKRGRRIEAVAPRDPLFFVVGTRGGHGGTRQTVGGLAELKSRAPRLVDRAMKALGEITAGGTAALQDGDLAIAGRAMDLAHGILSGLGFVSREVDEVVRAAREAGALGAKMSGAGGKGGAFVALAPGRAVATRIVRRLEALGAIAWVESTREL
jgi:mevalonate kinase